MQGYNDGLTSLPQQDDYAAPRLSPELAAQEDFADFECETVTKQIFEEGLGLAGVALLKQVCRSPVTSLPITPMLQPSNWSCAVCLPMSALSLLPCCLQSAVMPPQLSSLLLCCDATANLSCAS